MANGQVLKKKKTRGCISRRGGVYQEEVLTGEEAVMWKREAGRKGNREMEAEVQGFCIGLLGSEATVLGDNLSQNRNGQMGSGQGARAP